MFKIVRDEGLQDSNGQNTHVLVHDGEVISNFKIRYSEEFPRFEIEKKFEIECPSQYETDYLLGFKLEEYKLFVGKLILFEWLVIENFAWKVEINFRRGFSIDTNYSITPNFEFWKNSFSYAEYKDYFIHCISEVDPERHFSMRLIDRVPNFILSSSPEDSRIKNEILGTVLEDYKELITNIHQATINKLMQDYSKESIFAIFDFPKEIVNSCEQYLLYFAQFLKDLTKINASSNLKEEAGKVLFSVTPTDDVEALDKIREALAVYLNLPCSPIIDLDYSENFALMRLQQQVRNLQHSQQMAKTEFLSTQYALKLAQQNIDNQDQIITSQNSFIENQNKVIEKIMSKSVMIDSAENKEELEEICEGLKIGKSKFLKEQFGIDLNPATFAKGIGKKILGKQENNSIIETEKET